MLVTRMTSELCICFTGSYILRFRENVTLFTFKMTGVGNVNFSNY